MPLNQRSAMRWLVDLALLFVTARLETAFGLVTCGVGTVFAAECDEEKNGESTPMSPWNHIQPLALTGGWQIFVRMQLPQFRSHLVAVRIT
jgi:hypothetical protein